MEQQFKTAHKIFDFELRGKSIHKMSYIMQVVCAVTKQRASEITGPIRYKPVLDARFVLYHVLRKHTHHSLPSIGRFVQKDHTSILSALRQVQKRMAEFAPVIAEIEARL